MTHEVNGVVLFVSTASQVCSDVMRYVMANKLGVNVVRLDTLADRQRALNGKYVQVDSVPTMVVIYKDDTIQKYLGADKILTWMSGVVKNMTQSPPKPPQNQQIDHHPAPASSSTKPRGTKSKAPIKKSTKSKRRSKVEESDDDIQDEEEIDIDFGEMEEDNYNPQPKQNKRNQQREFGEMEEDNYIPQPKQNRRNQQRSRKTAGRAVQQRADGEQITPEYIAAQDKLKGLMVNSNNTKQKSSMSSVAEMARKMQEERKATLGYGDDH